MNDKVVLIAQREWFENVRTKAFWISLLIMPVILVVAIVTPTLLAKTKSARTYAVIDQSGWLLEAVERRAAIDDFHTLFVRILEAPEKVDAMPAWFATIAEAMREEDPEGREQQVLARAAAEALVQGSETESLPDDLAAAVTGRRAEAMAWWHQLDAETARSLDRGLSKARFQRIEPGVDTADALHDRIADEGLFAYMVIGPDPVSAPGSSRYVSKNLTDNDLERWFTRHATSEIRTARMEQRNVDPELATWLRAEFDFQRSKISDTGEEEAVSVQDLLKQWAPVAFVYLLWLSIFTVSQMLLSNTIEEKSNRLMEVLLSSVSPVQLMLGKIVGIAATGITMVGTWVACLIAAALALPSLFEGSSLDVDLSFLLGEPRYLVSFLVYFVLGYLLYAAILVAIGSVCNTLKEAQNLQSPLVILLMVPLLLMIPISEDPNGTMAVALSYFPPTTPFVMMNRAAGDIPWWEYALTTTVLAGAVVAAIWAAAKVFRIGVLMTGKPPTIREMLRWISAPVGVVPNRREEAKSERESPAD